MRVRSAALLSTEDGFLSMSDPAGGLFTRPPKETTLPPRRAAAANPPFLPRSKLRLMSAWIDRFLLAALVAVVVALAVTSAPSLAGVPLGGRLLLGHMLSSGALVIGLPIFAVVFLRHLAGSSRTSKTQHVGYLATVVTGLATIATVFLCMLPVPSTEQMHALMDVHGWFGFLMIPAVGLLLLGVSFTRSASHRRS
jgi:hypothetical protein